MLLRFSSCENSFYLDWAFIPTQFCSNNSNYLKLISTQFCSNKPNYLKLMPLGELPKLDYHLYHKHFMFDVVDFLSSTSPVTNSKNYFNPTRLSSTQKKHYAVLLFQWGNNGEYTEKFLYNDKKITPL